LAEAPAEATTAVKTPVSQVALVVVVLTAKVVVTLLAAQVQQVRVIMVADVIVVAVPVAAVLESNLRIHQLPPVDQVVQVRNGQAAQVIITQAVAAVVKVLPQTQAVLVELAVVVTAVMVMDQMAQLTPVVEAVVVVTAQAILVAAAALVL
jgi:hypothetical protein